MATIEMDVSEFKAMEKNTELLEEALKREKKLNDRVNELQKAEIKALETAKKKVVHVTEVSRNDYVITMVPRHELLQSVRDAMNMIQRGHVEYGIDRLETIQQGFFAVTHDQGMETSYIKSVGLDETKAEIRKDLENLLEDKYRREIEAYNKLKDNIEEVKNAESKKASVAIEAEMKKAEKASARADKLTIKYGRLISRTEKLEEALSVALYFVDELTDFVETSNMFNRRKKLAQAKQFKIKLKRYHDENKRLVRNESVQSPEKSSES